MEKAELRDRISLRDILEIVYKRKKFISRLFIVTVILVTIVAIFLPKKYAASTQILIQRNVSLIPSFSMYYRNTLDRSEEIVSQMEFIKSGVILESVADNLGMARSMQEAEGEKTFIKSIADYFSELFSPKIVKDDDYYKSLAVLSMKDNLKTDAELESAVITVSYTSKEPDDAVRVVNEITRTYLDSRKLLAEKRGTTKFYEEQIALNENILQDLNDKIDALKKSAGISNADTEIKEILDRLNSLHLELDSVRYEKKETEKKLAVLRKQVENLPNEMTLQKTMETNIVQEKYRQELAQLNTDRTKAAQSYRPDSRMLKEIDKRIAELEKLIAEEPGMMPGTIVTGRNTHRDDMEARILSMEADIKGMAAREKELEQQIAELEDKPVLIDEVQRKIARIEKEKTVIEGIIELHMNKKEESRIQSLSDHRLSNASAISYASYAEPATPPAILLILLGAVVSLFLGIGISLVAAFFDHSLNSERDIAVYLELPLLATIPERD